MGSSLEKKKLLLDAILTEYTQMKAESLNKLQVQITIISVYVSAFGILLSAGISMDGNCSNVPAFGSPSFFCMITPCVAICLSIIWFDQVYRQIKIAVYISLLEIKINRLLNRPNTLFESGMFWEQWLRNNSSNNRGNDPQKKSILLLNPNQYFYIICLGVFVTFPLLSYFYGVYLANPDFHQILIPSIIFWGGYGTAIIFGRTYVKQIRLFNQYSISETKKISSIPIDIRPGQN